MLKYHRNELTVVIHGEWGTTLYKTPDGNFVVGFLTGGAGMYEVFGVFSKTDADTFQLLDPFYLNKVAYDLVHTPEKFISRQVQILG